MEAAQSTVPNPAAATDALPLAVDLDGTLTPSDTFVEAFAWGLGHAALPTLLCLTTLRNDTSYIKHRLTAIAPLDPASIPYREDLLVWLRQEKMKGRKLHLVTAADQPIADAVAAHIGLFDSATGSHPGLNLKGPNKLAWLKEHFPGGFEYVGDSNADLCVWKEARRAHIAGDVRKMTTAVEALSGVEIGHTFSDPGAGLVTWARALRVHQWAKNALILVPWGLAGTFTFSSLCAVVAAFLVFNLVASATYLLNDLFDLQADRRHPTKRSRPLASGTIPAMRAAMVAGAILPVGLLFFLVLSPKAAAYVLGYIVLTLTYSLRLKKIAFIDAACLAALFTLRIAIGCAAMSVIMSPWLLYFSGLFFLSLGLAKRHVEVMKAGNNPSYRLDGRGYQPDDWPVTLAFGVASALSAIIIMMLFIQGEALVPQKYASPSWLYAIAVCLLLWLMRIWQFSHRQLIDDDPIVFALKDRPSLLLGAATGAAFLLAHLGG
jgi:4-hydroxybenzoate polyprenyltransferase